MCDEGPRTCEPRDGRALCPASAELPGAVHAGAWGLARAVRAEAQLPLRCLDGSVRAALGRGSSLTEPEAVLRAHADVVPRLTAARSTLEGPFRLHFHARGAVSNLFLEPQPACAPLNAAEVLLRVRAVGLNFRDVLNVLGEYPGDPGPPGADCAGVVTAVGAAVAHVRPGDAAFGLAHAALAHTARAAAPLLARMPPSLSFEEASTLPIVWSTVHVSLEIAAVRAGQRAPGERGAGEGLCVIGTSPRRRLLDPTTRR